MRGVRGFYSSDSFATIAIQPYTVGYVYTDVHIYLYENVM